MRNVKGKQHTRDDDDSQQDDVDVVAIHNPRHDAQHDVEDDAQHNNAQHDVVCFSISPFPPCPLADTFLFRLSSTPMTPLSSPLLSPSSNSRR